MTRLSDRRIANRSRGCHFLCRWPELRQPRHCGNGRARPARAYAVEVRGTVDTVFQAGTALGGSPAVVPANTNPVYGFHPEVGSVAFAAASGSANLGLNWHLINDSE